MKKKHKILKTFSFTSLALLMGAAGVFAFAPLGAGAPLATANESGKTTYTTEQGLITPKADDPVIYTTESGIEIKYGNAVPITPNNSLGSGNLKGFPYFTTTESSTTYTWVIIGFGGGWESVTPAGQAINTDRLKQTLNNLTTLSEIPEACFLVLANDNVATGVYNTSYSIYSNYKEATYVGSESIATTMEGYYTNGSWGLSTIKSSIQATNLDTYTYYYANSSWAWKTNTAASQHIYPLGSNTSSTFYWGNYLTVDQIKLSANQWVRGQHAATQGSTSYSGGGYCFYGSYVNSSGAYTAAYVHNSSGYRPAFCLKIT